MGNNEPAVDQSDLRIRGSYGLKRSYTGSCILASLARNVNAVKTFLPWVYWHSEG